MAKAIYDGVVIAESDHTEMVEGNHYFPPESVRQEFFTNSSRNTVCPWKGTASYYNIKVNGSEVKNAAWYYPNPSNAAAHIKDHVAFYGMVKIER